MKGTIFDVRRFSIHDGPGIRTAAFLKGCPLNCWWCHNPESQSGAIQIYCRTPQCIGCGTCASVCPVSAVSLDNKVAKVDSASCNLCGACVEACPSGAMTAVGRQIEAEQLVAEMERDRLFFNESGGGVTFSGGEPLAQPDFLIEMLERSGRSGLHRVVDTSGYASRDVMMAVAKQTDLILFDIKLMDDAMHRKHTGVSNAGILDNLKSITSAGFRLEIRIPMIPSITSDEKNITAAAAFIADLDSKPRVKLLPYHRAAMHKYEQFGMKQMLPDTLQQADDDLIIAKDILKNYKVEVADE
jgi:pyruvate formate lyase activating enzyme